MGYPMMRALVIDDDAQVRRFVSAVLVEDGWEVHEADSAGVAFELLHEGDWSLVLCDVFLGDANGFDVLRRYKEELPETQVILMTGHGSAVGALDATAFGAYDYLLKPFGVDALLSLLEAVRERLKQRTPRRVAANRNATPVYTSDIDLVGRSEAFIQVMKQVGRVATTSLPVLITGESGTGKEVVAAALHRRSQRASKAFVAVNCGAIPGRLSSPNSSATLKGHSPALTQTAADSARRPTAALSSSTRSGSCRPPFRSSSCVCYRRARFAASARIRPCDSTRESSRRLTAIWSGRSKPGASVKTSSTGSTP